MFFLLPMKMIHLRLLLRERLRQDRRTTDQKDWDTIKVNKYYEAEPLAKKCKPENE